ncbi:hypothetical protein AM593_10188, partial [Mytilus galloprovincialis]
MHLGLNSKVFTVNEKLADIDRRLQEVEENCRTTETDRSSGSGNRKDCSDLPKDSRSGIYRIKPDHAEEFNVYCEMTVDRGGWTVIQRRESGDLDFYQGWTKYRTGFGQLHREFWLGDNLNYHNGMPFTTFDRDNDKDRGNCAQIVNGAWWFKDCLESDLNGHYFIRTPSQTWRGIIWKDWKGPNHSLRASEMMIRRLYLIVLTICSICFGNPDGTYIAPLIDDPQRAPLVAISQTILKSFGKQLNEKVDKLIKQKFGDIHHRIQELEEKSTDLSTGTKTEKVIRDCSDLPKDFRSGIYRIKPDKAEAFDVYCEMTIDSGRWTVIQRRESGDLDFYLGWAKYKSGFGQLNREFWLGNDKIHTLTSQGRYELRIDLYDFDNNQAYAKYQHFYIGNETSKYKINVYGHSGNAGDSLDYSNRGRFTTLDRDNDDAKDNCARRHPGAWWYTNCMRSNLHGHYYIKTPVGTWNGVLWKTWKGHNYSLKATSMMIRRL